MFLAKLASFLPLLLGLGRTFPADPALRLQAARLLLLALQRPVVAACLVGGQPGGGGGEGAAQVLEGAGQVGDHLHQPVGSLGEALCSPVHVHPADGAGVAPGPAGRAEGVAVGAGGHGGPGDDTETHGALQQLQQSTLQLLPIFYYNSCYPAVSPILQNTNHLFFLIGSLVSMSPHITLYMLGDLLHDAVNFLLSFLVKTSQGSLQLGVTAGR